MQRGILIVALGEPFYGYLAGNLAASIKLNAPEMPIHLVHTASAIKYLHPTTLALFDSHQECPHEYYHRKDGKRTYIKAKTHLYDLTPFEETLFLDADTIMLPNGTIATVFERFKDLEFTMENRSRVNLAKIGVSDTYLWGSIQDIKQGYSFDEGYLYGLHSEFIYWKQTETIKKFFATVKKEFEEPKFKVLAFDGDAPDEPAFAIAMIKHNIYPHECPFIPLYWYLTDNHLGSSMGYAIKNYIGYSVGGNQTPEQVRRNYDKLAASAFQRLGLQYPYKIRQKRQILANRTVM